MAQILTQVRLGTVGNLNLSESLNPGVDTIDGKLVYTNDRILLKSQTNRIENGIYVVGSNGLLTRSSDFANGSSQTPSSILFIQEGDQLHDTGWLLSTDSSVNVVTVGVTEVEFTRFSLNLNILGADLPSSIILRSEKGYPLTIAELDNNFKFLSVSLSQKLNTIDFNQGSICDRINSVDYSVSKINANLLHGFYPSSEVIDELSTIALRSPTGDLRSTTFTGDLIGNADSATFATLAHTAHYLDAVNSIQFGGTGADNAADAVANIGAIAKAGDSMTGKLSLAPSSANRASLNISSGTAAPNAPVNGDVWSSATQMFYRLSDNTYTLAPLQSPAFTGTPSAPTPDKTSNSNAIASTQFVQYHVADINNALNLKATIDSPTLTGNPKSVTPPTEDNDTSIATTAFVVNKFATVMPGYYNRTQTDNAIAIEVTARTTKDNDLQSQIDDLAKTKGIPVGTVMHYAASAVPIGWLKCDGSLVSKNAFPNLFSKIGYTYGGAGNDFRLPDLRGEFLRGFDDGRGVDRNRAFGSSQSSTAIRILLDKYAQGLGAGSQYPDGALAITGSNIDGFITPLTNDPSLMRYPGSGLVNVSSNNNYITASAVYGTGSGDNISFQTRPRNIAMIACIKAYGDIEDPETINAISVLDSIGYKVDKRGDSMSGRLTLSADPTDNLHAATKQYVDNRVLTISLTPGPVGPTGPQGPQGPVGPTGVAYTITYGVAQYSQSGYTNQVGSWNDGANWFDVYPPYGKTMNNLLAFMPSIAIIHYAGGVDGNDSLRCYWNNLGNRIRVWVQNTEQRSTPAANWIAFWS